MEKHSVTIAGHKTSFTLEAAFWNALKAIAVKRGQSVTQLVATVDQQRAAGSADMAPNLSSALRVFVLQQYLPAETPAAVSSASSDDAHHDGGQ
jgi:predicted DNA-binding ribbon-helix-helix protein